VQGIEITGEASQLLIEFLQPLKQLQLHCTLIWGLFKSVYIGFRIKSEKRLRANTLVNNAQVMME